MTLLPRFACCLGKIKLTNATNQALQVQKSPLTQFDSWMSNCVAAATWIFRTPASRSGFIATLTPTGEAGRYLLLQAVCYYSAVYFMLLSVMWQQGASRWEQRCKMTLPAPFLLGEALDRCAFFSFLLFAVTPASSLSLLQGQQQQPVQVNLKASSGRPAKKIQLLRIAFFKCTLADRASMRREQCGNTASLQKSLNIKLANLLESFGKEVKRN